MSHTIRDHMSVYLYIKCLGPLRKLYARDTRNHHKKYDQVEFPEIWKDEL